MASERLEKLKRPKPAAAPVTEPVPVVAGGEVVRLLPDPVPEKPPKPLKSAKAQPTASVYRCGHPAYLTDTNCPSCRAAKLREKRDRNRANAAAKREANPSAVFRFPAGSYFRNVVWDGQEWTAWLVVPQWGATEREWSARGTSVEHVLRSLKDVYVVSLSEATDAAPTPPA